MIRGIKDSTKKAMYKVNKRYTYQSLLSILLAHLSTVQIHQGSEWRNRFNWLGFQKDGPVA